jgi:hypothetical protein
VRRERNAGNDNKHSLELSLPRYAAACDPAPLPSWPRSPASHHPPITPVRCMRILGLVFSSAPSLEPQSLMPPALKTGTRSLLSRRSLVPPWIILAKVFWPRSLTSISPGTYTLVLFS